MKITLISLDQELHCAGVRLLSACLKRSGYQVNCIFLPPSAVPKKQLSLKYKIAYPAKILDELAVLCKDTGLIGVSLMTNQFIPAVNITRALKERGITAPVIWGGIEPTVEPVECLKYADMVCLGEGEETLLELADKINNGSSYLDIQNLWVNTPQGILSNPLRPLLQDLDSLPFPDYDFNGHYIGTSEGIQPLTRQDLMNYQGDRYKANNGSLQYYPVISSRGCPYACSYCCNDVYNRLYSRQKRLRWRSTRHVLDELKMIQAKVGRISGVIFVDDNFTARSIQELKEFCDSYQAEINLPFMCQVSPLTVTEERMELLLDAGCVNVTMGVETASEEIAKMYHRSHMHQVTQKAIDLIETFRPRLLRPPTYQFIIDNPYESLEQTLETLNFTLHLPKPWDNPIYSLMIYPGTSIYEKALLDGLIKDKDTQIYGRDWHEHSHPYIQLWIRLYKAQFPVWVLQRMLTLWVVKWMTGKWVTNLLKHKFLRFLWEIRK